MQHSGVCKSRLPAGSGVQASCVCVLVKGHPGNIILRRRFIPGTLVNAGNFLRVRLQTCQILFVCRFQGRQLCVRVGFVHVIQVSGKVRGLERVIIGRVSASRISAPTIPFLFPFLPVFDIDGLFRIPIIIVGIFIVSLRDRLPSQSLVSGHIRSGFPADRLLCNCHINFTSISKKNKRQSRDHSQLWRLAL